MDDTQRIVKCGNLSMQSSGGFFRKWHRKYLVLYDGSKSGIQRLELFDTEMKYKKQIPAKIISLVDCIRVVTCQRHKTYTFEVRTKEHLHLFAAQSYQDMNDWVNCLRLVAFGHSSRPTLSPPPVAQAASVQATKCSNNSSLQQNVNNPNGGGGGGSTIDHRSNVTTTRTGAPTDLDGSKQPMLGISLAKSSACLTTTTADTVTASTLTDSRSMRSAEMVSAIGGGPPGGVIHQQQQQQQQQRNIIQHHHHQQLLRSSNQQQQNTFSLSTPSSCLNLTLQESSKGIPTTHNNHLECPPVPPPSRPRQRQPSIMGAPSKKPQPPVDSPFLKLNPSSSTNGLWVHGAAAAVDKLKLEFETMTPTVRGQLMFATREAASINNNNNLQSAAAALNKEATAAATNKSVAIVTTLDEEEENMLYCSIEDNPSEHNYRVKIIETELSMRCQLKCYKLTTSSNICQQYDLISTTSSTTTSSTSPSTSPTSFPSSMAPKQQQQTNAEQTTAIERDKNFETTPTSDHETALFAGPITFYQLIVGPQELTLLNDYSLGQLGGSHQQVASSSGLWSWPYQCIRRYGFDKDNCFMFEAGRKCTSGPGQFIVQTPKAHSIYQDVVNFVNAIRLQSDHPHNHNHHHQTNLSAITGPNFNVGLPINNTSSLTPPSGKELATSHTIHTHQDDDDLSSRGSNKENHDQSVNATMIPIVWSPPAGSVVASTTNNKQQQSASMVDASKHTQDTFFKALGRKHLLQSDHNSQQQQKSDLPNENQSSKFCLADNHVDHGSYNPTQPQTNNKIPGSNANTNNVKKATVIQQKSSSSSANSDDLTDESGYDQGEDSVDDSITSQSRCSDNETNRPTNKVMSGSVVAQQESRLQPPPPPLPEKTSRGNENNMVINNLKTNLNESRDLCKLEDLARKQEAKQNLEQFPKMFSGTGRNLSRVVDHIKSMKSSINSLNDDQSSFSSTDDFETNLIKEVYSEITKLHATFAFTTNARSNNTINADQQLHQATCDNLSLSDTNSDNCANDSGLGGTNQSRLGHNSSSCKRNVDNNYINNSNVDNHDDIDSDLHLHLNDNLTTLGRDSTDIHTYASISSNGSNSDTSSRHLSMLTCRPISTNCRGDITREDPTFGDHVRQQTTSNSVHSIDNKLSGVINHLNSPRKSDDSHCSFAHTIPNSMSKTPLMNDNRSRLISPSVSTGVHHFGSSQPYSEQLNLSGHGLHGNGAIINKLPGHYLINDVQYAKISKNPFGMRYESCL